MNEKYIDPQSQVQSGSTDPDLDGAATFDFGSAVDRVPLHSTSDRFTEYIDISSQDDASERERLCQQIQQELNRGKLAIINPRRKNGLIVYKSYHAEFAGPGAIIGGQFDLDATKIIAVGNLSLISPNSSELRKQAYKMRRQWVRLTKQIIDNPQPAERAQVILNQFEHWFDLATVQDLPDEAFALLVGVLPQTIRKVRNIELL